MATFGRKASSSSTTEHEAGAKAPPTPIELIQVAMQDFWGLHPDCKTIPEIAEQVRAAKLSRSQIELLGAFVPVPQSPGSTVGQRCLALERLFAGLAREAA